MYPVQSTLCFAARSLSAVVAGKQVFLPNEPVTPTTKAGPFVEFGWGREFVVCAIVVCSTLVAGIRAVLASLGGKKASKVVGLPEGELSLQKTSAYSG